MMCDVVPSQGARERITRKRKESERNEEDEFLLAGPGVTIIIINYSQIIKIRLIKLQSL